MNDARRQGDLRPLGGQLIGPLALPCGPIGARIRRFGPCPRKGSRMAKKSKKKDDKKKNKKKDKKK